MDAGAELGRNLIGEIKEVSKQMRCRTAEPVSLDQILRRERGQGNIIFPCSADHEQHWQPYRVDPFSSCTYVHSK